jgi:hypothetical protein
VCVSGNNVHFRHGWELRRGQGCAEVDTNQIRAPLSSYLPNVSSFLDHISMESFLHLVATHAYRRLALLVVVEQL